MMNTTPINIFDFLDYRLFISAYKDSLPKGGRGIFSKFAEVAQTHKVTISHIFSGKKDLTLEQAVRIGRFIGLKSDELRYWLLLVTMARAGTADLREVYLEEIRKTQSDRKELSSRLPASGTLSGEQKAIFYSSWLYSAVRVISSIQAFQTVPDISRKLAMPAELVAQVVEFLLESGLCAFKNGRIVPGPQSTYLESASPLVSRHHGNWRVKAMESHPKLRRSDELAYSGVVSLSRKDAERVREILARAIEQVDQIVEPSESEKAYFLTMDWIEI